MSIQKPFHSKGGYLTAILFLAFTQASITSIRGQEDPVPLPAAALGRAIIVDATVDGVDGAPLQIQTIELGSPPSWDSTARMSFSFAGPMGMAGRSGELMNLINNESVRKEIDLVDDQYKKMRDFNKTIQEKIQKDIAQLINPDSKTTNSSVKLRGKKIAETIKKHQTAAEKQLKELLLPHQVKRLEQVANQMTLKNRGTAGALASVKFKEALGLSDEEVENIKARSQEIQADLEKEIAKLREKAKKDLLKELTPAQRKKMDEIMGDEFEYKQPQWQQRLKTLGTPPAAR